MARTRWMYALAAIGVIGLGLASRSEVVGLPWFAAKYSGDALWGLVVFVGFGFLLRWQSTLLVTVSAVGFACSVEFSQLYHPLWLDAIRATRFGGLVLGTPSSTFAWGDIAAYLVGIACGIIVELAFIYKPRTQSDRAFSARG